MRGLATHAYVLAVLLVARAASAETGLSTWRDWYEAGGWIMHLLALCSVLVVAIAGERLWSLRRGAVLPRGLVRDLARGASAEVLLERGAASASSLAALVRAALEARPRGEERVCARVAEVGAGEAVRLNRNLALLAAVANVATLLGLLGTVLGMIDAFQTIAAAGASDARIVATGIFRALVTTAGGLSVAIVALSLHALFRRRIEAYLEALEGCVTALVEGDDAALANARGFYGAEAEA